MPKITITQDEVQNHSGLPAMLTNKQTMNLNGLQCKYADISQNDFDGIESSLDADAYSIGVLPKHVIEN